jgi:hypothetical protein
MSLLIESSSSPAQSDTAQQHEGPSALLDVRIKMLQKFSSVLQMSGK